MEMTPAYGTDPMLAYAMGRDNNCKDDNFMNNPFFYLIFIWLFAGFGGNGFGGGFGGNNGLTSDFLYQSGQFQGVNQGLAQVSLAQANQTNDINRNIDTVKTVLGSAICDLGYRSAIETANIQADIAKCCCETGRSIDSVKYETQAQTTAILQAICEDGRATRDLINSNTVQQLRDELQAAQLVINNSAQTRILQEQLSAIACKIPPQPVPAYPVPCPCAFSCPGVNA